MLNLCEGVVEGEEARGQLHLEGREEAARRRQSRLRSRGFRVAVREEEPRRAQHLHQGEDSSWIMHAHSRLVKPALIPHCTCV